METNTNNPDKNNSYNTYLIELVLPVLIGGIILLIAFFGISFLFYLPIAEETAMAARMSFAISADYIIPFFLFSLFMALIATRRISSYFFLAISIAFGLAIFLIYGTVDSNSFFEVWGLVQGFILGIFYLMWYQYVIPKEDSGVSNNCVKNT
jgi:O-antigen/teichoic acid export membrane protein